MEKNDIEQLYKGLGKDKTENAQILETIIECKHQNEQFMNAGQALYRDLKMWCYNYISSKQEKDYGYDIYEHSKIIEKLNDAALTDRQKLALIHYVKYVLSHYNDDGAWLDKDMTDVNNDDLFFIASLFLPVKKSTIVLQPYTEIAAFDDAESASVYYDVVSKMAQVHSQMEDFGRYKQMIEKFQGNEK